MKIRVAAVQPLSGSGAQENRNATESLIWLRRAAEDHADLVVFPEGYPGPINPSNSYDALGPLAEAAAEFGLHVIASRAVPLGGVGTVAGPEGVLAQAEGEGLIVADLDFDRLAFLRAEDEKIEFPKRYTTIPGVQRWRRPELYAGLVAKDHAG